MNQATLFEPTEIDLTKYLFYTGKGGVGKTTAACATAVNLADRGHNVLLVSTDPASNLQDVFDMELTNKPRAIEGVPNLKVANFDPVTAADEYKESVVGPYRGILPVSAIQNMEEQLSGTCTVEIASFNEFANFLTDDSIEDEYDHILFDTAPTGHTLRMLQLPSAWTNFLDENTTGVSCLGQLSGLGDKREMYANAVETLSQGDLTTLMLVTRPDYSAIQEANRASKELLQLGINNQRLIINGLLEEADDAVSQHIYDLQRSHLKRMPESLSESETFYIPLRSYNVTGIENLRILLNHQQPELVEKSYQSIEMPSLNDIVQKFIESDKKIIFTMGKGGVGKTTVAIKIAKQLAKAGKKEIGRATCRE